MHAYDVRKVRIWAISKIVLCKVEILTLGDRVRILILHSTIQESSLPLAQSENLDKVRKCVYHNNFAIVLTSKFDVESIFKLVLL